MLINKQGKLIANVAQPTVCFETAEAYEAWKADLPTGVLEENFIVIKTYELAPGGVYEVETKEELDALDDNKKVTETLYLVTSTDEGYRYDADNDKFVPLFGGGELGTKVFYGADLAALKAFSDKKKNKEYLYYAFAENMMYRYNDAEGIKDFELIGAESDVIYYTKTIANFATELAGSKLKANKHYIVKDGDTHRIFFTSTATTAVLVGTPYGDEIEVVTVTPLASPNSVKFAITTDYTGFYVNAKQAAYLDGKETVYVTTKPAAADMIPGILYDVNNGTTERLYLLDKAKTGLIEINEDEVVQVKKDSALPAYTDATFGTLYIDEKEGTLKAKNPNYVSGSTDPAKKDPYWTLGTDIQALIKRIEKLEAISNDVRVLANKTAIETLINNGEIDDEDVVDMLFIAKDTKKSYIAEQNPEWTEGGTKPKFLAKLMNGGLDEMIPALTTAEWKALTVKPDYALITDAAYDADIDYTIQ